MQRLWGLNKIAS